MSPTSISGTFGEMITDVDLVDVSTSVPYSGVFRVPGRTSYLLNGVPITPERAAEIVEQWQREQDDELPEVFAPGALGLPPEGKTVPVRGLDGRLIGHARVTEPPEGGWVVAEILMDDS